MSTKQKDNLPSRLNSKENIYLSGVDIYKITEGEMDSIAQYIMELKERLILETPNAKNYIRFEMEIDRDYDGETEITFYGVKQETDAQYNSRLKQIENGKKLAAKNKQINKAKKEANEKAEYERLKKKFEK